MSYNVTGVETRRSTLKVTKENLRKIRKMDLPEIHPFVGLEIGKMSGKAKIRDFSFANRSRKSSNYSRAAQT